MSKPSASPTRAMNDGTIGANPDAPDTLVETPFVVVA
jgi:hypothetical protein